MTRKYYRVLGNFKRRPGEFGVVERRSLRVVAMCFSEKTANKVARALEFDRALNQAVRTIMLRNGAHFTRRKK